MCMCITEIKQFESSGLYVRCGSACKNVKYGPLKQVHVSGTTCNYRLWKIAQPHQVIGPITKRIVPCHN